MLSEEEILKSWKVHGEKAGPKTQMLLDFVNMLAKAIAMADKAKNIYGTAGKILRDAARAEIKVPDQLLSEKHSLEFTLKTSTRIVSGSFLKLT